MKKGTIIGLGILAIIVLGLVIGGGTVLTSRNTMVSLEENINAQHISNKSNYDQMIKSAKEMVQVTDMYAEDFEKIYKGLIEGRNQDTALLFKVVKESNPNLDSKVYLTLQRELSSNRKEFDNNQKMIADKIREYNTFVKKHFIVSAILGKDTMDANSFIVTSDSTEEAFEKGKADEINLRGE